MKIDIFTSLTVGSLLASFVAFSVALGENYKKGYQYCLTIALLAFGFAGLMQTLLEEHTIYLDIILGVLSGIFTDDIFAQFEKSFMAILSQSNEYITTAIKAVIEKKFKGDK